jgi:EpsI family protein
MRGRLFQAGVVALLMAFAAVVAAFWKPSHFVADSKPRIVLEDMIPTRLGEWQVDTSIVPIPPSPDLQRVLDTTYDQTLARTYRNAKGERVMLSMAYGRNQHEGMNTHRPEICYPGQGFSITQQGARGALLLGSHPIQVTRLVTALGARNEPITYWLIVGDQVTFFGSSHKWVTLGYGLRGQIPDGLLVRVSSIDPQNDHAFAVHQTFVIDMLNAMQPEARQLLVGNVRGPA